MSKLGRHRSSGTDLDALLRTSSHAIMIRVVVHTLLCVAALILGFSISREAVLIVVSFRLPYGSLFVKTTSSPHGHEVAIISFPRMQQHRTFSEAKFSMSHHPEQAEIRFAHRKEPPLPTLVAGAQAEQVSFTESKIKVHRTNTHAPTFQSLPQEAMAPSTKTSKSSRVLVGRHKILIRAWPHPDPIQIKAAHHLMRIVQDEQWHDHGPKERKQLLIITPTYVDTFQSARLTCLVHTLRLVPRPLLWIVVEAGNINNDTAAMLSSSTLPFRHFSLQEATSVSTHLMARLRTEGLRYIHEHRLEGVVVFADDTITYTLNYFNEAQKVNWFGSFSGGDTPCSKTQDHACIGMPNGISPLISRGANQSTSPLFPRGHCNSSTRIVYRYHPSTRNETEQGNSSIGTLDWSDFAFNARLLWQNPEVSWIQGWNEVFEGNDTFVQSPLDFIKDATPVESLAKCGCFCDRKPCPLSA